MHIRTKSILSSLTQVFEMWLVFLQRKCVMMDHIIGLQFIFFEVNYSMMTK